MPADSPARKKALLENVFLILILSIALFARFLPAGPNLFFGIIGADGFFHSWLVSETLSSGALPEKDPYSWGGGRPLDYFSGFHLFLSSLLSSSGLGSFLSQKFLLSLAGPLFFSLAFFIVALNSKKEGTNPLISSAIFAFVPVLIWKTSQNFLTDSLTLLLLTALLFLQKNYPDGATFLFLLSGTLIHPVFLFAHLLALAQGVRKGHFRKSLLVVLSSLILALSIPFLFGRMPLPRIESLLSQNVPESFSGEIFEGANPMKIAQRLGPSLLPFLLRFPENFLTFLLPLAPAAFGALELDRALFLSSLFLIAPASRFVSRRKRFVQTLFVLAIIAWGVYSVRALSWAPLKTEDRNSLGWLSENSQKTSQILSLPGDGYLVSYVSGRRNSIDGRFFGTEGTIERSESKLLGIIASIKDPLSSPPESGERFLLLSSRSVGGAPETSRSWELLCSDSPGKDGVYYFSQVSG